MKQAYITSVGSYLPGQAISNEDIENVIGFVDEKPSRYRSRVLKSNGIRSRHYALDKGAITHLNEDLAVSAIRSAISASKLNLDEIDYLSTGTTLPDLIMPGFASMVHGRLEAGPLETLSASGVCCAGMSALKAAVNSIRLGDHHNAVVVASENPSAMLRASRFEQESILEHKRKDKNDSYAYFNADFLRWMLSDGAGAVVVQDTLPQEGLALKVEWISIRSFANELPVCMYAGTSSPDSVVAGSTWLANKTVGQAEADGMMVYRQDIKILEQNIVKLASQEAKRLQTEGMFASAEIDHFLPHYSSNFFKEKLQHQLQKDGVDIPEDKWFSNLQTKGNTGAASIFIMLDEAVKTGLIKEGERVLLMVPESARFTYSYALITCLSNPYKPLEESRDLTDLETSVEPLSPFLLGIMNSSPLSTRLESSTNIAAVRLGRELALVWQDFEQRLLQVPLIQKIENASIGLKDYLMYLKDMKAQVVEGARWISRAASNMDEEHVELRKALIGHAHCEQSDFLMLETNFIASGGKQDDIKHPCKNIGSESLSAYIFNIANEANPISLFGATFIFEGLGSTKAGNWAKCIQMSLTLPDTAVSFLAYHGEADEGHYDNLAKILGSDFINAENAADIVKSAKVISYLYAAQLAMIGQY